MIKANRPGDIAIEKIVYYSQFLRGWAYSDTIDHREKHWSRLGGRERGNLGKSLSSGF